MKGFDEKLFNIMNIGLIIIYHLDEQNSSVPEKCTMFTKHQAPMLTHWIKSIYSFGPIYIKIAAPHFLRHPFGKFSYEAGAKVWQKDIRVVCHKNKSIKIFVIVIEGPINSSFGMRHTL